MIAESKRLGRGQLTYPESIAIPIVPGSSEPLDLFDKVTARCRGAIRYDLSIRMPRVGDVKE